MIRFHRRCGDRVTLLNQNLTAIRNFVEFNHGLILSAEPLIDDVIFEVRIDRKVNVWNGSLEIGVTTLDPEFMEMPATATKLRNTAWILSGNSIVKDCITLLNDYGPELDSLREGECVGVTKTSKGELLFFINGRCLGVAARDIPERVFAVIDLYGQCVQVTVTENHYSFAQVQAVDTRNEIAQYVQANEDCGQSEAAAWSDPITTRETNVQMSVVCPLVSQDHIRFHPRCGILVKLSSNNKTAERARPLDDYNNGVVMTHRPLFDNELFEIRIDKLVDKWSGSIEVGVTTHNPATIRFPSTMTNMDSGTIMMSGCKVLLNGQGTCTEYSNYNLDELREGDTVAMMRKSNDNLHYFINGIDQGVATDKVPAQVWGVIDLYGMTVRVTIIDPCEGYDSNISQSPLRVLRAPHLPMTSPYRRAIDEEPLLFHPLRDSNVVIVNDNKTAHRPYPSTSFNNGVVMTNRTLKTNELFQVRLDLVVPKWAGSIEIGVTQQSSNDIKIPFKMSNEKSGTWALTGEDVIRDGSVIIPQYARNLNQLVEGDTVGVMRKELGILHFYINGIDQGPAAFNIPELIFGIVDLYGRVAQATIIDMYTQPAFASPESPISSDSIATVFPDMCFHRVHGHNARLKRNRLTAMRATVFSEFNDAVLFSSRPLRECDMFEIRIDKMVDCWIGSLEIGVTAIRPDDLEAGGGVGAVAGTATDLTWDTYILSGAAMMKDGECVRSGYPLDLDTLTEGSRVGMMWHADRSVHYYLDGMDMGKAWYVPHLNIYAVVDLYGQCAQVSIVQNGDRNYNFNGITGELLNRRRAYDAPPLPYWVFSEYCGDNIILRNDYNYAQRIYPNPDDAMVFSSQFLIVDEIFEVQILECKYHYAGNFRMGITDVNILNANVNRTFPRSIAYLPHFTAYIDSRYVKYSKPGDHRKKAPRNSITPSFEWLRTGDRVGFKKTADSRVLVYYNSELLDTCFEKVPDKVYVCCDLGGQVTMIKSVPRGLPIIQANQQTIKNDVFKMHPAHPNGSASGSGNNGPRQNGSINENDVFITEEEANRVAACVLTAEEAAALRASLRQRPGGPARYVPVAAEEDEDEEDLDAHSTSSDSWVSFNEEILVDFMPSAPTMAAMEDDTSSDDYDPGYLPQPRARMALQLSETPEARMSVEPGETPEPSISVELGETPEPRMSVELGETPEPRMSVVVSETPEPRMSVELGETSEPLEKRTKWSPAVEKTSKTAAPADKEVVSAENEEGTETAPADNEGGAEAAPAANEGSAEAAPADNEGGAKAAPADKDGGAEAAPADNEGGAEVAPADNDGGVEAAPADNEGGAEAAPADNEGAAEAAPVDNDGGAEAAPSDNDGGAEGASADNEGSVEAAPADNEGGAEAAPVDNDGGADTAPSDNDGGAEAAPADNDGGAKMAPDDKQGGAEAAPDADEPFDDDDELAAGPSRESATPEPEPRRPLPYTFHYVHGRNVRLCSSDTVAMRYRGYAEGIAIASQPIRRGNHFRFRVDRLSQEWEGTLCIGAVAALPSRLPRCALDIETPAWVITNDVLMTRGRHIITEQGRPLDNITENSVLTLHFRFNSELALEIDGVPRGVIGVVPRLLANIYPTIDLYGRVIQVSILLHPHVLLGGNSLDLPAIEEHCPEEVQESPDEDEYGGDEDEDEDEEQEPECGGRSRGCPARVSAAVAWRPVRREPLPATGPGRRPDWLPGLPGLPNANDARNYRIRSEQIYPVPGSLYHSLILPGASDQPTDNDEAMKHILGGRSASPVAGESDDDSSSRDSLANALSLGSRICDDDSLDVPEICDTNIRHNDRYPEASDADLLDNELADALTLDATNMPDLTDERSPSDDESTRRDELWSDGILHVETLRYLTSIIKYNPEEAGRRFADRDWVFYSETNGNCEHMHLALKFWNYVVLPYPDMREVVASGQVRCYCTGCQPEAVLPFAGWVRIERGARGAVRGEPAFWHVVRSMLVAASAAATAAAAAAESAAAESAAAAALPSELPSEPPPPAAPRPATFVEAPERNPSAADIWFDEEGKPHHSVVALEIDSLPDDDSANDRLIAYMIYLRSHMTFNQEQENEDPLSFED